MMSPLGISRRVTEMPSWWAEKFHMADKFFRGSHHSPRFSPPDFSSRPLGFGRLS